MRLQFLGAILILMGTAIGAGMLALPLVSSEAGFWQAAMLMVVIWAVMLTTGFLVLEVCLAFPVYENNFDSMAYHTLGPMGRAVAWITTLTLLYALTAAYVSGDASLLFHLFTKTWAFPIPQWLNAVIFTLVFGGIVFCSTRAVDLMNRGLMTLKGITVVIALVLLMPHIDFANLARSQGLSATLWAMAPIFLTSFGFHTVIPSLANYLQKDVVALKRVVFWGATIPLMIYLLWLFVVLGIMPLTGPQSFASIHAEQGSAGLLVVTMIRLVHSRWAQLFVNIFSNVAMTTSFLGVTLGLFDFLIDATNRKNNRRGRFQVALLTFVPPLLFAIFYPQGFVLALTYAGLCVAVLEVVLPALMAYQLRRGHFRQSLFHTYGGVPLLMLIAGIGIFLVIVQVVREI